MADEILLSDHEQVVIGPVTCINAAGHVVPLPKGVTLTWVTSDPTILTVAPLTDPAAKAVVETMTKAEAAKAAKEAKADAKAAGHDPAPAAPPLDPTATALVKAVGRLGDAQITITPSKASISPIVKRFKVAASKLDAPVGVPTEQAAPA